MKACSARYWMKKSLMLLAVLISALVCIAAYNQIVVCRLSSRYPVPGQFIEVNGRKMHIHCTGTGSPTVVLESGLGGSWLDWALVQPELSKTARVCSYDRAGMGWSDAGPKPRSSAEIAAELAALLAAAKVPPPYLLVGHSLGGLHIRVYAAEHPKNVVGLVFVDATNPKEFDLLPPEVKQQMQSEMNLIGETKLLMASGVARLMGVCNQLPSGAEPVAPYFRVEACRVGRMTTIEDEYDALKLDREQAAKTGPFKGIPLLVLSHDPKHRIDGMSAELQAKVERISQQMQDELAGLSDRSRHVVVENSGHYIQLDRPDAVITEIRKMVLGITDNQAPAGAR